MLIKLQKNSQKDENNRQNVDKVTNYSEFRRNAKIFFCAFAQINQKNM